MRMCHDFHTFGILLLSLAVTTGATAQTPEPEGFTREQLATALLPGGGEGNPGGDGELCRIEFPNAPIAVILSYYEKLVGKRIIKDANLDTKELSISSSELLTRAQASGFVESALLLNGYVMIRVDDSTMKLINENAGKNPRSQGLPVINSVAELPLGDTVVNYVMQLDNITPAEAARTFSHVVELNKYGAITPLKNSDSVVITENTSVIRSLIELKEHVDVPPTHVISQLIDLRRADAEQIAEILKSIFAHENSEVASDAKTDGDGGSAPGTPMIVPYRRTNSLMVVARPVDVAYAQALVESFDRASDGGNFLKRKLQYVSIIDYLPAFYNALMRSTDIDQREDLLDPNETTQAAGRNGNAIAGNSNASNGFGNGGGAGRVGIYPDRLSEPEPFTTPQSYVIGNTLMIADPHANSLIVSGSPEHIEIVERLIDEVDVQPKQVYISTVIGQLTLGDEIGYSLDAFKSVDAFTPSKDEGSNLLGAGAFDQRGASAFSAVNVVRDAAAFGGTSNGLTLLGSFLQGNKTPIDVAVRLFARDNQFRLLSRPSVYAQNNSKAVILSGQRIAVPTSTLTSTNTGNGGNNFPGSIASNIEYLDVVLKLEVIPLINSDEEVTLRIAQVNDTVNGTQIISGNEIPRLNTQELITTVTVRNGQTIVLGGLITEREDKAQTGLPVIRRIPILGRVLGSTNVKLRREELLIFIQPFIIDSQRTPGSTNDVEKGRTKILPETLDFADPRLGTGNSTGDGSFAHLMVSEVEALDKPKPASPSQAKRIDAPARPKE